MIHLSSSQLRRAADIKDKIESLEHEITRLLGSSSGAAAPRKRRKMSAAARAKIGAAMRARWAKQRGPAPAKAVAKKPKRTMSAAGRKRLAQLAKARWAKVKAAGRKKL